jgi:hypothetical protein
MKLVLQFFKGKVLDLVQNKPRLFAGKLFPVLQSQSSPI